MTLMTEHRLLGNYDYFPTLRERTYLNFGSVSLLSTPVQKAMTEAIDRWGREGTAAAMAMKDERTVLRGKLAEMLGCSQEDLAFIPSTTIGGVFIASTFKWKPGQKILLFKGEFPSNVRPWVACAERFGLEVVFVDSHLFITEPEEGLRQVEEALKNGVTFCAVSLVQYSTGLRMPVKEISRLCQSYGSRIFVDGIQGVGAVPVEVATWGVDFLACGSHKWLMGPEASGFLYVKPESLSSLNDSVKGWLGFDNDTNFLSEGKGHVDYHCPSYSSAQRFELCSCNSIGYVGLETAIDILNQIGTDNIYKYVQDIQDAYLEALEPMGFRSLRATEPELRSPILSFLPPVGRCPKEVIEALNTHKICASMPDGNVRFGLSWPNRLEEVKIVAEALKSL